MPHRSRNLNILNASGAGGGAITEPVVHTTSFLLNDSAAFSSSSFATKGSIYSITNPITVSYISVATEGSASETYKMVIAEVSGANKTIDVITATSQTINPPGLSFYPEVMLFVFQDNPTLESGKEYAFLVVRTDGLTTDACSVVFPASIGASNSDISYEAAARIASIDPQVGDDLLHNTTSSTSMTLHYT